MRFVSSQLLFLIWTLPVLGLVALWGLRRRRRILSDYVHGHCREAVAPLPHQSRYGIKAAMVTGAMLLGIFALSGPQYGFKWEDIHRRGVDLVIALDCSRSMTATDIAPSRLERAKREIVDLLNMMTGDRVALVAFAGTAFVQCPLTLDYASFHLFLTSLSPETLPVGGTDLAGAVKTALSAFDSQADTDKAVILITDGEATGADPVGAAQKAQEAGVRLFCLGVGDSQGAPIPQKGGFQKDSAGNIVMSRLDETTLKKMADMTNGAYVRSVTGDMDLDLIYKDRIRKEMKAAELEGGRRKVWENRFQWALVPALVLLIWEMLIPAHSREKRGMLLAVVTASALLLGAPGAEAGWLNRPLHDGLEAYEAGDYPKALKSFIDAQLQDPDRPEIDFNIGNTHYRLGDYDAAAQSYQAAARSKDPAVREKALYNLGNSLYRAGQLKASVERYQKALELAPGDEDARKNLEFVQKALEKQPKPPPQGQKGQGKDKNGNKDQDEKRRGRDGQGKKSQEGASRGEQGQSKAEKGQAPGQRQNNPPEPQAEAPPAPGADGKKDPGTPSRARAEQILNRLQDQPGRALMPSYGKRSVEKDW